MVGTEKQKRSDNERNEAILVVVRSHLIDTFDNDQWGQNAAEFTGVEWQEFGRKCKRIDIEVRDNC